MSLIDGTNDDDQIISGALTSDTLIGGSGNDTLGNDPTLPDGFVLTDAFLPGDFLDGGEDDDLLLENPLAPDTIEGGDGNDEVSGFNIPEGVLIQGIALGPGGISLPTDMIRTGDGVDIIRGFFTPFVAFAGHGDDLLLGGDVGSIVYGNQGLDTLIGGLGDDTLYGGQNGGTLTLDVLGRPLQQDGIEYIFGDNAGAAVGDEFGGTSVLVDGIVVTVDNLLAGGGSDLLYGNVGSDVMDGGNGADTLFGGQGADTIVGGDGSDVLFGNRGDDVLAGGGFSTSGNSDIDLGLGPTFPFDERDGAVDEFRFGQAGRVGNDTIHGFETGIDNIVLAAGTVFEVSDLFDDKVIILVESGETITLIGLEDVDISGDITA
ncbi:MAG: hypothetical protein KI792_01140 [Alphaproteobacteria bacterium]|nr:hypothetical protein [Alphaproteobacteria bacterium SS10]